jgi:hypothetical protein
MSRTTAAITFFLVNSGPRHGAAAFTRRGQESSVRLQIMLSADELRAVDDWRFKQRMPSRASAIRELLRLGLQNEGIMLAEPGLKSQDFGVLDGPSS